MACARPLPQAGGRAPLVAPCLLARQQRRFAGRAIPPAQAFKTRDHRRRGPLGCRAHAGHDHTHSHSGCSGGSHATCSGVGHDHHHEPDAANPAHRVLKAFYDATHLTPAAAWLESSLPSTVAKIGLFVLAATAAGWAASGWAASAAQAQLARSISTAATAGVYLFAGLPAAVDLSYDVTAGHVGTHVLMNLAVLGTLCTGHALEVGVHTAPWHCSSQRAVRWAAVAWAWVCVHVVQSPHALSSAAGLSAAQWLAVPCQDAAF